MSGFRFGSGSETGAVTCTLGNLEVGRWTSSQYPVRVALCPSPDSAPPRRTSTTPGRAMFSRGIRERGRSYYNEMENGAKLRTFALRWTCADLHILLGRRLAVCGLSSVIPCGATSAHLSSHVSELWPRPKSHVGWHQRLRLSRRIALVAPCVRALLSPQRRRLRDVRGLSASTLSRDESAGQRRRTTS